MMPRTGPGTSLIPHSAFRTPHPVWALVLKARMPAGPLDPVEDAVVFLKQLVSSTMSNVLFWRKRRVSRPVVCRSVPDTHSLRCQIGQRKDRPWGCHADDGSKGIVS